MMFRNIWIIILIFFFMTSLAIGENFSDFDKDSNLGDLSSSVRCFFDAAAQNDSRALAACFSKTVAVNIAGMRFNGPDEVVAFAERDIWGGKYKVEKVFNQGNKEIVHCLFWPEGWSSPEPPIEYQFQIKDDKIVDWFGKYR
jgi:hypothetical protein